jgi:hypothetical protein
MRINSLIGSSSQIEKLAVYGHVYDVSPRFAAGLKAIKRLGCYFYQANVLINTISWNSNA